MPTIKPVSVTRVPGQLGDDLRVVDAARVSFHKESTWASPGYIPSSEEQSNRRWQQYVNYRTELSKLCAEQFLQAADFYLIQYLAENDHWTPFAHVQCTFRIEAPVFVARQLVKHQIGLVWNEESRRYVDDPVSYYKPDWRQRPDKSIKQGSSGPLDSATQVLADAAFLRVLEAADAAYEELLKHNVAPEQARAVLPVAHHTKWMWTGSMYAWARVARLRLDSHAQGETRDVAELIDKEMLKLAPASWAALRGLNPLTTENNA